MKNSMPVRQPAPIALYAAFALLAWIGQASGQSFTSGSTGADGAFAPTCSPTPCQVVKDLNDRAVPIGADLWILTALPGFGLIRLGRWARGLMWAILFSAAFYFASTDSPDPTQFADYGRYGNVPPAYPRGAEWALLALAALLWVTSIALTVRERRRPVSSHPR